MGKLRRGLEVCDSRCHAFGGQQLRRQHAQGDAASVDLVFRSENDAQAAATELFLLQEARGAGAGRALLMALIPASEAAGIWTLWSSIHTDNAASIALHEQCGFRMIGRRERIALRGGVWTDTFNMERRSAVAGV